MTHRFAVTNAAVFDGVDVQPWSTVMVEGDRIVSAGDDPVPEGVEVVDGTGCTLLPGLFENHSHVCPSVLETALAFGVTTEFDLFSFPDWMVPLKAEAARRNDMADVKSSLVGVTVHQGHPSMMIGRYFPYEFPTVRDASMIPDFVAARVAEGADFIKIFLDDGVAGGQYHPTLDTEMARVAVEEAHRHSKVAIAHIASAEGVGQAVEAGVDALAHAPYSGELSPALIAEIKERDIWVIPALGLIGNLTGQLKGSNYLDERTIGRLTTTERHNMCMCTGQAPAEAWDAIRTATRALYEGGVELLVGTDVAGPGTDGTAHGLSLLEELELMVGECGVSALDALRGATGSAARRWKLDDRGRIAPGLQADLLMVGGDPLADISAIFDTRAVWRRGERFSRETYLANTPERERLSAEWAIAAG